MMRDERMNSRVLVIDDEESIRDGFQMILRTSPSTSDAMDSAASLLFDDPPILARRQQRVMNFHLDVAANGLQGIARVRAAAEAGTPYAVIFCDIRMPGIDGVETIEEIRKIDSRAEVVFITAYSDHSVESIVERAGANVSYFIKPFVTDEARQLATKLVLDWNKARELEELMLAVSSLRGEAPDIDRLLKHLLRQTCSWLDTDSAALFRLIEGKSFQYCLGVGELGLESSPATIELLKKSNTDTSPFATLNDGTVIIRVKEFGLLLALPGRAKLTPDRRTLLLTFLEHAALAIRNRETEVALERSRRMAGVGQAVGFLLHDLRHPLGTTQMVLRLLREKPELFANVDDAFEMMEQEVQRGLDLVGDILALCRSEVRIQTAVVVLKDALARAIRIWHIQASTRGIEFQVDIPRNLTMRVDVGRLERALSNLIKNALEAVASVAVRRIELSAREVESNIEIRIADSGSGVPDELLSRLFEPFATADKPEGMGFGLAIVKQVVDAHNGRIDVRRVNGETHFNLLFPNSNTETRTPNKP